jgi:hypothetical protein
VLSKKRKVNNTASNNRNIPPVFACPITMDIIIELVLYADGFLYEEQVIERS